MWRSSVVFFVAGGAAKLPSKFAQATFVVDAYKLRQLLSGAVVNVGLRFGVATGAQAFGVPAEMAEVQFDAFAGCLASLKLEPSAREDSLGDVIVMQHAPGFELQARIVNDDGP